MENEPNLTKQNPATPKIQETVKRDLNMRYNRHMLSLKHQAFIDYTAVGGLMMADETTDPKRGSNGEELQFRKMSMADFGESIGVTRTTLWTWRKTIPSFWDRVAERQRELGSQSRIMAVWNGVFLKAAGGNAEAAKLYLANHDPNFRMPTEKIKHELDDSWAGLARGKDLNTIDGEAINENPTDQPGGVQQAPGVLPPAS